MKEEWEVWRLCETLTVAQAACLIAGLDPAQASYVEAADAHGDNQFPQASAYAAARQAIGIALLAGKIKGTAEKITDFAIHAGSSTVDVESLRNWLRQKGFTKGFFFPDAQAPDYLNPEHPRYAPKLAAAVSAWLAVGEVTGRSAKSALDKWLREHAAQFGLTKDDGNPNETGIEEISKVANWQPGGAPKTPG